MSEPGAMAEGLHEVLPGIWHWTVQDDRIGYRSDAYALGGEDGVVLVDPLPVLPEALAPLGDIAAIVISGGHHQRSAWRHRDLVAAPVWAPHDAHGLEGRPDESYGHGDRLPGGLAAIHAPGPTEVHYALWRERGRVLLLADLLIREDADAPLRFVPAEYQDDPDSTPESVRRLLDLDPEVLLLQHGAPLPSGGAAALRAALERHGGRAST